MRKWIIFSAVFSLFLLVPASITWAQTISSIKGLTTAVFPTQFGKVKVYLPDDIRPGESVSGTVIIEPAGENARQKEKNAASLMKSRLSVDGTKILVPDRSASFDWLVQKDRQAASPMELLLVSGNKQMKLVLPAPPSQPAMVTGNGCFIPEKALTNAPLRVLGDFDGNSSNTNCLFDQNQLPVLAESPRQCIVYYPAGADGSHQLTITEKDKPSCSQSVSGVKLNVTAGKLNLQKGENTYILIEVSGLEGLKGTALLQIENRSKEVVNMLPLNSQTIPLTKDSLLTGTYSRKLTIHSLRSGNFFVDVYLDLPDVQAENPPTRPEDGPPQPGDTTQPQPADTTQPEPVDTTQPEPVNGDCTCEVSCQVVKVKGNSSFKWFDAFINAACRGFTGKGTTRVKCEISLIRINWHLSDNSVVTIDGDKDKKRVKLKIIKPGPYVLNLTVTVLCKNGTKCVTNCNYEGTIPPPFPNPATCEMEWEEYATPSMTGRLKPRFARSYRIRRDDFIPLGAEGNDDDQLYWNCIAQPKCEPGGYQITNLNGRVKFEWIILKGEGSFSELGCMPENKLETKGDYVIFKPPVLPLPVIKTDTTVTTTILLKIIDDNPTQIQDETVIREITITTKRSRAGKDGKDRAKEDYYDITVSADSKKDPVVTSSPVPSKDAHCRPVGPEWNKKTPIPPPTIILPAVPDNEFVLPGQWMLLRATDSRDMDHLKKISCESQDCINPPPFENDFEDNVLFKWSIEPVTKLTGGEKGKFGNDQLLDTGAAVIYKVPENWPASPDADFYDIKIKMFALNPGGGDRHDDDTPLAERMIRIYRPGVKLSLTPLAWLPEEDNHVSLTSMLMYKDGAWKPGPAHACRIHFFELMNVSNEKGTCMNDPLPGKAKSCRDLKLKNEKGQEAFLDTMYLKDCRGQGYFMQARTEAPVNSYTIHVYSEDFGAYGFLRSFANINAGDPGTITGQMPYYTPIPVEEKEARHPSRTMGRGIFDYHDNRVSIPLDVDQNHLPDNGWMKADGTMTPDPAWDYQDEDDQPAGDGVNGDGLTNYEEYRGFMVLQNGDKKVAVAPAVTKPEHTRCDPAVKTLFIHRTSADLDISLFESISGLETFLLNGEQYVSDPIGDSKIPRRWINFNYTNAKNVIEQWGLKLIDGKAVGRDGSENQGIALNINKRERPSPPNWEYEIRVNIEKVRTDIEKINKAVEERFKGTPKAQTSKLDPGDKIRQVVAHELLHGCNVCHHGEKPVNSGKPAAEEYDLPNYGGLRSGNINCVMRYDNLAGVTEFPGYFPEPIGKILCESATGTGYNAPVGGKQQGKGNASVGNCIHQIHVTARGGQPPACGLPAKK